MNTTASYRGFNGSIIHDPNDHLYYGKIQGIRDFVIYHGDTPEEAETIFREAVDEYLSDLEKDGKELHSPVASITDKTS